MSVHAFTRRIQVVAGKKRTGVAGCKALARASVVMGQAHAALKMRQQGHALR